MGWDKRGYYYRSRKVKGRVEREYVGTGTVANLVAELDAADRDKKAAARQADQRSRQELAALDAPLETLDEFVDLVACATLLIAGYRQHRRGEWRKKRGEREQIN
jgi:hypothetical protein